MLTINDKNGVRECLEPVLVNPDIVKIFYAGQSDLLWLQRDFNLFVVNFFDVRECANFMDKTSENSLIGLVNRYCGIALDKT